LSAYDKPGSNIGGSPAAQDNHRCFRRFIPCIGNAVIKALLAKKEGERTYKKDDESRFLHNRSLDAWLAL